MDSIYHSIVLERILGQIRQAQLGKAVLPLLKRALEIARDKLHEGGLSDILHEAHVILSEAALGDDAKPIYQLMVSIAGDIQNDVDRKSCSQRLARALKQARFKDLLAVLRS